MLISPCSRAFERSSKRCFTKALNNFEVRSVKNVLRASRKKSRDVAEVTLGWKKIHSVVYKKLQLSKCGKLSQEASKSMESLSRNSFSCLIRRR